MLNMCVQLPTYADNVALPTFAYRTHSSKPAAVVFAAMGPWWDRQTDRHQTLYRYIDPAPHTKLAVPII